MSLEDWLIDIALIALVLRQIHGRKLTTVGLLWPIGLVLYAGASYLTTIPTDPTDLLLIVGASLTGALLGVLCGHWSTLRTQDGVVIATAGPAAAAAWLIGMGGRLGFAVWIQTNAGERWVGEVTATHHLRPEMWAAALIFMALTEVIARTSVLALKWRRYVQLSGVAAAGTSSACPPPGPRSPRSSARPARPAARRRR